MANWPLMSRTEPSGAGRPSLRHAAPVLPSPSVSRALGHRIPEPNLSHDCILPVPGFRERCAIASKLVHDLI
jgi:hypothetical protein